MGFGRQVLEDAESADGCRGDETWKWGEWRSRVNVREEEEAGYAFA